MIYIKSISEIRKGEFDEVYAIVNSMDFKSDWIKHEKSLSPNIALFNMYSDIKERGNWNEKTFKEIYVPRFLKQIVNNENARQFLNYLHRNSKTKNIALVCYCSDESICHRSIVMGLLQGAKSATSCETDYSKYYEEYKKIYLESK